MPDAAVVAERLGAMVADHEPGWRLPRHSILARRLQVSMADIERAVQELMTRGLVRRLGDGSLHRSSPAEYLITLEGLPGLASYIDPLGASIACVARHVSWRRATEDIGRLLGLEPGTEVTLVRCRWVANGMQAAISLTYLHDSLRVGPVAEEIGLAWLDPLADVPGIDGLGAVTCATAMHIELQPPSASVAKMLGLQVGVPAAIVSVLFRDREMGSPLALTTVVLRADLFRIVVNSAGPWGDRAAPLIDAFDSLDTDADEPGVVP